MKYTTRSSVTKWQKEQIPFIINEAEEWLKKRYPHIHCWDDVQLIFTNSANRPKYYNNKICKIPFLTKLYLYEKATCTHKTKKYKDGIVTGEIVGTISRVIHEVTHFIQHMEKRKYSEVETTQNEIDYLKEKHPNIFNLLIENQ